MSSFINPQFSSEHPGVNRLESAIEGARQLSSRWTAARGLVALLLSAVLAAAVAVAYQVMDTAEEGHLLALWVALWAVVFASLALYSGTLRRVLLATKTELNGWAHRRALARADARLWRIANSDARVMADLQNAISRNEVAGAIVPADVQASLRAVIPSTLVSSRERSYGFYI